MTTLAYHLVDGKFYAGVTRVTPRAFARQMKYLADHGFTSCLPCADNDTASMEKRVCITFDDGYECVYSNAFPILQRHGFRACVFAIAGYVGKSNAWDVRLSAPVRHLSWQQLSALAAAGWEVGSHSLSHLPLTWVGTARLRSELRDSKALLEDRLGRPVRFFSYPFGVLSEGVVAAVQEAGYKAAYGMYLSRELSKPSLRPFNRERRAVYLLDSLKCFVRKAEGTGEAFRLFTERLVSFASRGSVLLMASKIT
ncbi:MAG: polysaccharide deacetylase family protein [bacterium]|nr:polysaccharide deacetylase family protein [candidate division KSB1 bacterium]MDH7558632.1 polysaccharide deacetylase family protein [bacterium]